MIPERFLDTGFPPNSPPITILLVVKRIKTITEQIRKTNTVKPNFPAGTS